MFGHMLIILYGMHIFLHAIRAIPVLHFGLAHCGSRPFIYVDYPNCSFAWCLKNTGEHSLVIIGNEYAL